MGELKRYRVILRCLKGEISANPWLIILFSFWISTDNIRYFLPQDYLFLCHSRENGNPDSASSTE